MLIATIIGYVIPMATTLIVFSVIKLLDFGRKPEDKSYSEDKYPYITMILLCMLPFFNIFLLCLIIVIDAKNVRRQIDRKRERARSCPDKVEPPNISL